MSFAGQLARTACRSLFLCALLVCTQTSIAASWAYLGGPFGGQPLALFNDAAGKMNLSLRDKKDGLLLVPQFTLAADTDSGNRPSFAPAAPPDAGEKLFDYVVTQARLRYSRIATGRFGADMKVSVVNDGPVTFWLRVAPPDR